jgi:hypothetical protein
MGHRVLTGLNPLFGPVLILILLVLHLALELGDPGLETDNLELEIIDVG